MPSEQVLSAQHIYGARASVFDNTWHPEFAAEYMAWAPPLLGQHVLDLACGTGLVSLLAKEAVGDFGTVTGIDVTDAMLDLAKEKAKKQKLDVKFINHDAADLESLKGTEIRDNYDLITCASALVLLDDPANVIKQWAGLLKPGGRLITDVPTENARIFGLVFEEIAEVLGLKLPYHVSWVKNIDSLQQLMIDAGLEIERAFEHAGYTPSEDHDSNAGGTIFDDSVPATKPDDSGTDLNLSAKRLFVAKFGAPKVREKARSLFAEKFKNRADSDGIVRERNNFYVVIGKKL